jgi:putative phosphoesterase
MKLFVISDIHGSLEDLKNAIDAYKKEKGDIILILGDELYHGPRNPIPNSYDPQAVSCILNGLKEKIIAVRGNCDSEVDQMLLEYPIMSDYSTVFWENKRIFMSHGHIYNKDNLPSIGDGDILIYGHTHVPLAEKNQNIFILNPGSITFPKENFQKSYGIFENNSFRVKTFDGKIIKEIIF